MFQPTYEFMSPTLHLVEQAGAQIVGIGCLWCPTSVDLNDRPLVLTVTVLNFPPGIRVAVVVAGLSIQLEAGG